ncbi:MAG: glucosaminidase domain-containing protein [Lachnospiraceae bacterium]|nr:glucosaminidase domain-containing protein [Lachnospiraceae bacterium]
MGYTNSSMVVYTKLSPNHSGQRTMAIDRITPHCVVGQCTAEGLGDWFYKSSTQASSNYGIDKDGRVGMYVEEKNRSWCSSSNANDQRAITIECASDTTEPYAFRDVVYKRLIELCIDICKRNGKNKLIWFGDKDKTLNYSPKSGEMILTVHRWFANKSCPGNWMYARMGDLAEKVTKALQGSGGGSASKGTQASVLKDLSEADAVKKVGALFTADQKKSGILASVSLAQFILESGYGKSELAQNANNIFGMKCSLSGNTWSGSSWDGKSRYTKKTQEQNADGSYETITADFRKYSCIEDSIADHSAYLIGAMNGKKLRYDGLKGCTDYKKAVQIIKDGGYATSLTYVEKLCSIIEKWKLADYDAKDSGGEVIRWYRVRKSWADSKTQKGAYKILDNAKKCADQNPGYKVFDADGKVVYEPKTAEPAVKVPFLVKVSISDLNIRSGAGTNFTRVQFCPPGVYTIMEVKAGQGSKAGWGRLKSGIGWLSLDFCQKL